MTRLISIGIISLLSKCIWQVSGKVILFDVYFYYMQKIIVNTLITVLCIVAVGILAGVIYIQGTEQEGLTISLPQFGDEKEIVSVDPAIVLDNVERGEAVLLDVRTPEELSEDGYAVGSMHIEFKDIVYGALPEVPYDTTIYTYCAGGARAEEAKRALINKGFTNVINIGGLIHWIEAGGPITYDE